jgi:hypothetical protein
MVAIERGELGKKHDRRDAIPHSWAALGQPGKQLPVATIKDVESPTSHSSRADNDKR